jgi:hypothetical protein
MGRLSKLLLGREPAGALRLARDTGVLVELLPEFARAIGFDQESRYHSLTVDEHTFEVVQAAADRNYSLAVRLAALFHDLGKPYVAWRGTDGQLHYAKRGLRLSHEQVGCSWCRPRLHAPGIRTRFARVVRLVRYHMFQLATPTHPRTAAAREARDEVALELVDHKEADYPTSRGWRAAAERGHRQADRFRCLARERSQPHRLADRGGRQRSDRGRARQPRLTGAARAPLCRRDLSRNTPRRADEARARA